ncbi:MAG: thioredoxin [Allobaculum sp.]
MAIRQIKSVDDFKEIVENNKLVLVDFFATWCGPCKMLHPVLETVSKKLEGDVVVAQADIDLNQDLANAFRVQSVPTLIFFKDGKGVLATAGYMDEAGLMRFIDAAKAK